MIVEFDEQCRSCKGTGLYVGMGERDGAAVVCHTCDGTGCHHFKHEYKPFEKKANAPAGVLRVYEVNPGIGIGHGNGYRLSDFGGMPLKDWQKGKPFPEGSENRRFTCPAWWYQTADYDKKPNWDECIRIGSFSNCPSFKNKEACWKRFDDEQKLK